MLDQVGGLSREEVAGMIERATSNFLKTMKGEHTISPFIGVFPCVCMRPCIFICFDYDLAPLQTSFGPCRLLLLWVLGISGCTLFWKILKDGRWPAVVLVIHSSIRLMCGWNVQQIFAIVKIVKDEFCQLCFICLCWNASLSSLAVEKKTLAKSASPPPWQSQGQLGTSQLHSTHRAQLSDKATGKRFWRPRSFLPLFIDFQHNNHLCKC